MTLELFLSPLSVSRETKLSQSNTSNLYPVSRETKVIHNVNKMCITFVEESRLNKKAGRTVPTSFLPDAIESLNYFLIVLPFLIVYYYLYFLFCQQKTEKLLTNDC